MSHTATMKVELGNRDILKQVCQRLGLTFKEGKHSVRLFSESVTADFEIRLPGWNYPIAIVGDQVKYDNYNGNWGKLSELTNLQDQYSRDVTIAKAQELGMTHTEETGTDDEIILTLYDYSS